MSIINAKQVQFSWTGAAIGGQKTANGRWHRCCSLTFSGRQLRLNGWTRPGSRRLAVDKIGEKMGRVTIVLIGALFFALFSQSKALAAMDVTSTVTALRLANTITGGYMPTSDPLFTKMVTKVQAGDMLGAALIAAQSKYFANYLARRLALQMQNPALDASIVTDNDATAFLIAHFVGAGSNTPSISKIWSDNLTYMVNNGDPTNPIHAADLKATDIAALDWSTALLPVTGQTIQTVTSSQGTTVTTQADALPAKHVGGYITLSDRLNDNSFAMYGATNGTNLRMIEGIWEIATGLTLVDVESASAGQAYMAPRFVPENNPSFFHGQGQAACLACHGGGMSNVLHGYATVADVFNFDAKQGFVYNPAPTTQLRKSLGSDAKKRTQNLACNFSKTPSAVCNPDSAGVDPNQGWDLAVWNQTGVLGNMGWTGPTTGQGLNSLGQAIGQAAIVYQFMTKRVIKDVCPLGTFSSGDIATIAAAANPYATPAGTDDVRTIVAMVASNPSCL